MGTPLQVGALVARTLSLLHNIPLLGVNHCVGRMCQLSSCHRARTHLLLMYRHRDGSPDHSVPQPYRTLRLGR